MIHLADMQQPPQFGQQMQYQTGHIPQPMQQEQGLQGQPQGGGQLQQMMTTLAQNPAPEVVQAIVQSLQSSGDPAAAKMAQRLMQSANNPQELKQMAMLALQSFNQ